MCYLTLLWQSFHSLHISNHVHPEKPMLHKVCTFTYQSHISKGSPHQRPQDWKRSASILMPENVHTTT